MSNQEKVARALHAATSIVTPWESLRGESRRSHLNLATAAIDALADVDGIAAVLRAKAASDDAAADEIVTAEEFDAMVDGLFSVSYQIDDRIMRIEGAPEAIAAAVVAWMKDQA